jgi:hypothetical protein
MCSNPKSPWLLRADDEERRVYWFRADCKLWTCEECSQNRKTRVGARAGRGAEYFAKIGYPVQFTTLTCSPKVRDTNASIERWRETWPRLRKRVSRRCQEFHYALFPEQDTKGAVHVHILETSGLPERFYKDHCAAIGLGYMADVQDVSSAYHVVSYVTKYLTKTIYTTNWPRNYHRFRFSRQWPDVDGMETSHESWRVFLSLPSFDDEIRYWVKLGYKPTNTHTGEINDG